MTIGKLKKKRTVAEHRFGYRYYIWMLGGLFRSMGCQERPEI